MILHRANSKSKNVCFPKFTFPYCSTTYLLMYVVDVYAMAAMNDVNNAW